LFLAKGLGTEDFSALNYHQKQLSVQVQVSHEAASTEEHLQNNYLTVQNIKNSG